MSVMAIYKELDKTNSDYHIWSCPNEKVFNQHLEDEEKIFEFESKAVEMTNDSCVLVCAYEHDKNDKKGKKIDFEMQIYSKL